MNIYQQTYLNICVQQNKINYLKQLINETNMSISKVQIKRIYQLLLNNKNIISEDTSESENINKIRDLINHFNFHLTDNNYNKIINILQNSLPNINNKSNSQILYLILKQKLNRI